MVEANSVTARDIMSLLQTCPLSAGFFCSQFQQRAFRMDCYCDHNSNPVGHLDPLDRLHTEALRPINTWYPVPPVGFSG